MTPSLFPSGPAVLSTRPKIAELVFRLYGRSLHPELFEVCETQTVERGDLEADGYRASVRITNAGHVITWEHQGLLLTEVATSSHQPLPQKRQLMSHRFGQQQSDSVDCRGGITYNAQFGTEIVTPETFTAHQQEIERASLQHGVIHRFQSNGRVGLGALSYIHIEARDRCLRIRCLHTFPDDLAIVKCQSEFRLPS